MENSDFTGNNILFTGHSDGQVVTWDISSGAKTGSVQLDNNGKHSPINCLAADTTKVIVGMSNNLIVSVFLGHLVIISRYWM